MKEPQHREAPRWRPAQQEPPERGSIATGPSRSGRRVGRPNDLEMVRSQDLEAARARLPTAVDAQAAEARKLARGVAEHRELRRN